VGFSFLAQESFFLFLFCPDSSEDVLPFVSLPLSNGVFLHFSQKNFKKFLKNIARTHSILQGAPLYKWPKKKTDARFSYLFWRDIHHQHVHQWVPTTSSLSESISSGGAQYVCDHTL